MRRKPRLTECWLWLLLLLTAPASGAQWGLEQLMRTLAAGGPAVVQYTEEKRLAVLDIPLITRGELRFVPPDFLERTVAGPDAQSYRVHGDQLRIETRNGLHTVQLSDYPSLQAFIESFRATLTGDLPTLQRYYQTALEGYEAHWRLILTPRLAEMASKVRQILIEGEGGRIRRIETVARDGDTTVMRLREGGDSPPISPGRRR